MYALNLRLLTMHVCTSVCMSQAADLRLLSKYVYVSHSNLQNLFVSEDVKILIERTHLTFNVFFLNCEGDTSRSRARLQTSTYVCMFELQTLYVYVCFESETSEHVCMFQAAGRVCMSH